MSPDDVFLVSQARLATSTPSPGGLLCAEGRRCVMDAGSGQPSITERRVAQPSAATPRQREVEMLASSIAWWLGSIPFLAIWVMIETSPDNAYMQSKQAS